MKDLIQTASDHKVATGVAVAWIVREAPLVWKSLKSAYPALRDAGGIRAICRNIIGPKQFPAAGPDRIRLPAEADRPGGDSGDIKP